MRNIRFGRHENFVRVVLDMSANVRYRQEMREDGRAVVLHLSDSVWRAAAAGGFATPQLPLSYEAAASGDGVRLILRGREKLTATTQILLPSGKGGDYRLLIDVKPAR